MQIKMKIIKFSLQLSLQLSVEMIHGCHEVSEVSCIMDNTRRRASLKGCILRVEMIPIPVPSLHVRLHSRENLE